MVVVAARGGFRERERERESSSQFIMEDPRERGRHKIVSLFLSEVPTIPGGTLSPLYTVSMYVGS